MPVTAVDSLALSVSSLSRGNILYEIDGQPALDLYKKYLGDKSSELPQFFIVSAECNPHGKRASSAYYFKH
jgi:hypothetical protein